MDIEHGMERRQMRSGNSLKNEESSFFFWSDLDRAGKATFVSAVVNAGHVNRLPLMQSPKYILGFLEVPPCHLVAAACGFLLSRGLAFGKQLRTLFAGELEECIQSQDSGPGG